MKDEEANGLPETRWSWRNIAKLVVTLVLSFAIVLALMFFLGLIRIEELLSFSLLMAVIFTLGILSHRFKVIGATIRKFFAAYFRFLGFMLVSLGPLSLFNWLSQLILNRLALGFQIVVFIAWGLLLTGALALIVSERNRERFFISLQKIGHFVPVAYSLNFLMIAVMFFSSVTYVLVNQGVLKLGSLPESNISAGAITDFYFWHFLDAVPLLKVNETLRWKEPLTYDSGWLGLILLIFKLSVIVPVIAAFAWYWKQVGGKVEKK